MFPAGQGDCALFGINGFNMLIDGGFNRKPCSWEFIRHLDRLDAVLVTRLCENNVCGMSTLMQRKSLNNTYPQIGYVFCNIGETKVPSPKEEMMKNKDDLVVSVVGEGHNFTQTLNELKLKPHQCWRDSSVEPFVLYHKVGHGTLEMHVLSPPKDSKEMKDFLTEWSSYKETFSCIKSGLKSKSLENAIPLSHATSICAVLIWRPADPKDTITRILFPGSAPQSKIFESLERLKNLDVLKQPVVTKSSLSVVVTKTVNNKFEKSVSRASIPNRKNTASPALSVSSVASRNGDVAGVKKEIKKVVKEVKKDNKDVVKKEIKKEVKKDAVLKEIKKTTTVPKKDTTVKKEVISKESKKDTKDIKQITKKDTKELKAVIDKKQDVKNATKKVESASSVGKTSEVKKTTTTVARKSTTTAVKKETSKTTSATKSTEVKKAAPSKVSEPKAAKDVSNKKAAEAKTVSKTKPKSTTPASKSVPKAASKATAAASKSSNKVTKAVAASSIVASVVAVTAAAFELNEKKDEIVDAEPEVLEKEPELVDDLKDLGIAEKSDEMNVSPLPPEALSPTPSESISLTPSDTLSSAPLETVSPTPPLANEQMSVEEKEVNEIKEIEQDPIPYEVEAAEEIVEDMIEEQPDEIAKMIAQHQEHADVMSSSFMGSKDLGPLEDEIIVKTEAPDMFASRNNQNADTEDRVEPCIGNVDDDVEDVKGVGYDTFSKQEENIDDQLAQMSMEGSYCAGIIPCEQETNNTADTDVLTKDSEVNQLKTENDYEEEDEQQQQIDMSRSFVGTDNSEEKAENDDENVPEANYESLERISHSYTNSENVVASNYQDNQFSAQDLDSEYVADMQEKEVADEKYQEDNRILPEPLEEQHAGYQTYSERHEAHSIQQSFANRVASDDYDLSRKIIEDADMQETSVDEPEEIVRKESAVSITLNDENSGVDYDDDMRRKSCTESEDDVDIQNYMINDRKDSFDQDKLSTRRDADSDNEDVVKSPTPHAIVDYEGHVEDINESDVLNQEKISSVPEQNTSYLTEKQDFDEKDRDSAEDQEQDDTDDGEMIRHPTPEMKYSEDEMRDPIGQHYITAPVLKSQVGGITEEPLYEEPEDDVGSDRSVSPVIETPVFGSVVEADFPELVTVSGGTTPSEPHSPKAGFDTKKFVSEAAVMDALSEHDCSEGSTHSPLCYDGNSAFELPVTAETIEKESLQDFNADREDMKHEVDSADIYNTEQEKDSHEYVQEKDSHAYEQEKDSHAYEQQDSHAYAYEQEKDYDAYEQKKDSHVYEQEMDSHAFELEKGSHAYDLEKDSHTYEQEKDFHAYGQEKASHEYEQVKDSHAFEQEKEAVDMHSFEHESGEMRGFEQYSMKMNEQIQSKESNSYEEGRDSHAYGQEGNETHSYDQKGRDLRTHEQGEDLQAYNDETKDVQQSKSNTTDLEEEPLQKDALAGGQQTFHDDKLDIASGGNYDAPSDDESYSQNDKSETKSEKSDGEDEKSDIHRDDRSDNQHDSKSDMMDDDQIERKSDMHEDDRSDSHFDDKQDGYDGKGENAYEVSEDTRSHNYGSEQFRMDDDYKYEMQYEKYEIQDKFQHDTAGGLYDSDKIIAASEIQNESFEDKNRDLQSQSNIESVDGNVLSNVTTSYDCAGTEERSKNIHGEIESDVDYIAGVSTTNFDSKIKENEEITDNFNIPSRFQDNDSEKYSSNISSVKEFNELNISNQEIVDAYTMNFEAQKQSENVDSSHGQYENILTKETYSEYSKDNVDFQASGHSNYEGLSGGISFDANKLQELDGLVTDTQSTEHDILSPQHTENLSGIENKVLTEITEAHQYETLSKFEANVHTSNVAYNESSSIENLISDNIEQRVGYSETTDFEDKNFNSASEETKHFSSENKFKHSEDDQEITHEITDASYSQMSSSMHAGIVEESIDRKPYGYDDTLNYGNHAFDAGEIPHLQTRAEVHETEYKYSQEIEPEHDLKDATESNLIIHSESQSTTNVKDQSNWSHSTSEYTTQYVAETGSSVIQEHSNYSTHSEQETSYIINSRFHSDSPEDNIMRSDSSPDVPPYPLDSSGQLADLNIKKEDYPGNMNLPKVATPLSPSKTRNANRDSPYGQESSEDDEDSSFVPGNVSPYAYTNKAYAKEDEDVDGNHIYKETMSIENTTTGIVKEFEGNNPNTLNHQVGYEYQETKAEYEGNNPPTMTTQQVGYQEQGYTGETNYDFRLEEWGKPMGLPTPPDSTQKTVAPKKTEKKSLGKSDTNGKTYSPSVSKMSSPMKKPKATKEPSCSPVYVDLAYVPHHGDPQYCDIEFFKKVRARYYVFSGINPSKEVLNALLEAKKGWKEDLEVTIIPTYETDTLGYWMAQNQDDLAEYSIEVAPSASRCTVNLQDHETSCAAYRLEF